MTNDRHVSPNIMAAALKGATRMTNTNENALVDTFIRYLKNTDYTPAAVIVAATGAVTQDAPTTAWDGHGDVICSIAENAVYAVNEIQNHKTLAAQGTKLFFLPMFGFNTVDALTAWGKANDSHL